jgi:hypothetical protein
LARGTYICSNLSVYFVSTIYYSYEIPMQNFRWLHLLVVEIWKFWLEFGEHGLLV